MQNTPKPAKLALSLVALVISMILLSIASVPLYNLFCKATGFAGTVKRGNFSSNIKKGKKSLEIVFDANVDKALPWRFYPKQRRTDIKAGENILVFYEAENLSKDDIIGTAIYNVSPLKAGQYFVKVHCFCFEEQMIPRESKMLLPVSFYIDPAIEDDPEMDDVHTITLSYSFFMIRKTKH